MVTIQTLVDFIKDSQISVSLGKNLSTIANGANNIFEATESEITFISVKYKENWQEIVKSSNAGLIFVDERLLQDGEEVVSHSTVCISKDAKASLLLCAREFFIERKEHAISANSDIHPSVKIGKNVRIESFCQIEKGVTIGDERSLSPTSKLEKIRKSVKTLLSNRLR